MDESQAASDPTAAAVTHKRAWVKLARRGASPASFDVDAIERAPIWYEDMLVEVLPEEGAAHGEEAQKPQLGRVVCWDEHDPEHEDDDLVAGSQGVRMGVQPLAGGELLFVREHRVVPLTTTPGLPIATENDELGQPLQRHELDAAADDLSPLASLAAVSGRNAVARSKKTGRLEIKLRGFGHESVAGWFLAELDQPSRTSPAAAELIGAASFSQQSILEEISSGSLLQRASFGRIVFDNILRALTTLKPVPSTCNPSSAGLELLRSKCNAVEVALLFFNGRQPRGDRDLTLRFAPLIPRRAIALLLEFGSSALPRRRFWLDSPTRNPERWLRDDETGLLLPLPWRSSSAGSASKTVDVVATHIARESWSAAVLARALGSLPLAPDVQLGRATLTFHLDVGDNEEPARRGLVFSDRVLVTPEGEVGSSGKNSAGLAPQQPGSTSFLTEAPCALAYNPRVLGQLTSSAPATFQLSGEVVMVAGYEPGGSGGPLLSGSLRDVCIPRYDVEDSRVARARAAAALRPSVCPQHLTRDFDVREHGASAQRLTTYLAERLAPRAAYFCTNCRACADVAKEGPEDIEDTPPVAKRPCLEARAARWRAADAKGAATGVVVKTASKRSGARFTSLVVRSDEETAEPKPEALRALSKRQWAALQALRGAAEFLHNVFENLERDLSSSTQAAAAAWTIVE